MSHQPLNPLWVAALVATPFAFAPLAYNGTRIVTAGILTPDESEGVVKLTANSPLVARPDRVPEEALQLSMVKLETVYCGESNVGWLAHFPALSVTVGKNYTRVLRGHPALNEQHAPQMSMLLKTLVVMEIPDVMTLLLSTRVRDVRV